MAARKSTASKAAGNGPDRMPFEGTIPSGYVFDGIRLVKAVADKPLRSKVQFRASMAQDEPGSPDTTDAPKE